MTQNAVAVAGLPDAVVDWIWEPEKKPGLVMID